MRNKYLVWSAICVVIDALWICVPFKVHLNISLPVPGALGLLIYLAIAFGASIFAVVFAITALSKGASKITSICLIVLGAIATGVNILYAIVSLFFLAACGSASC